MPLTHDVLPPPSTARRADSHPTPLRVRFCPFCQIRGFFGFSSKSPEVRFLSFRERCLDVALVTRSSVRLILVLDPQIEKPCVNIRLLSPFFPLQSSLKPVQGCNFFPPEPLPLSPSKVVLTFYASFSYFPRFPPFMNSPIFI